MQCKTSDDYHQLAQTNGIRWLGPVVANIRTKTAWECHQGHCWQTTYRTIARGMAARCVPARPGAIPPLITTDWPNNGDLVGQAQRYLTRARKQSSCVPVATNGRQITAISNKVAAAPYALAHALKRPRIITRSPKRVTSAG